ncbi:MAG TPA: HAD-IG family 5'-nucleotidase, partial [Anaeromyxobacteraceae bacterium]|nr:HAD-IG family 5'-nucleotidase [Anaeromyxobacteraceae bacterium]
ELAFEMTLERLVRFAGYPESIRALRYDPEFVIRGLVVDKVAGNIFKMDRHNHVGRCYHGRQAVSWEDRKRLYRDEKIHLSLPRFAWIDTLFALPEACLFAEIIDQLEGSGRAVDYAKLYDDVREAIDTVHRDGSLKEVVKKDLASYLVRDAELGPALHRLRSGGKKLFLLTNSLWDYTDAVMRFVLDGVLHEYPSWRNYFDVVVTGAAKPGFFSEKRPLLELGPDGERIGEAHALERGHVYEGGSLGELERLTGISGERVLYVGDHIYGDILRSKKSSLWRTCLVVQELESEIAWLERCQPEMEELARLEEARARMGDEISIRKSGLNALDRRAERAHDPVTRAPIDAERREMKHELEVLRRAQRDADLRIADLQRRVEDGYNRWWGLTFKEGNENSRFGEQIEDYACLYTSRVSNFLFYSPMHYHRSPRAAMPHERHMLHMAPYGDDHAAAAAADRPSKTAQAGADAPDASGAPPAART